MLFINFISNVFLTITDNQIITFLYNKNIAIFF